MTTAANNLSPNHPDDPFINAVPNAQPSPHRYASFDNQVFSLYNSGSPSQAKRALEAHLKDTERRIQDASKLGTTLLQQQRELAARLKEVEQAPSEEITPELQKKLDQLEKDYTEIGKESARAFLPKSRIVSTDFSNGPQSPAVFANHALPSPTKPTVNSRKQRNQPTNRVHDIEFATEISTSLLAQVRQLQAVLAEKENALKDATAHKEQLEADMAGLMQRLRALDESEQKCKDENWNLETQMQDLTAQLKTATDHEQRLTHQLKLAQAEKDGAERELEDLKAAHGKLSDDHETIKKHHEAELFGLRRDVSGHESARDALVKKVEELTAQNTQLAKAVAARWQADGQMQDHDSLAAHDRNGGDLETPDVSPQNSPIKATPRHGMLETETLKSSLTHAHRMIQNLKNTVHREKTEKFELKRMLQDARDELESRRGENGAGPSVHKKRRNDDGVKFKKPQKLGPTRSTQQEIIIDDEDWEDQSVESPSRPAPRGLVIPPGGHPFGRPTLQTADSTDAFETANERETTDAFETANEDDDVLTTTEAESAFQTGAEDIHSDSSDQLTETESGFRPARRSISSRPTSRPGPLPNKAENRHSFMSTASVSGDEFENVRTPVQAQQPKYKLRLSRGGRNSGSARNSAIFGSDSADSPASLNSTQQTPMNHGQSLGDELNGLSDESDSGEETPAEGDYGSVPSSTEAMDKSAVSEATTVEPTAKTQMVDSGMMTEPWEPESKSVVSTAAGAIGSAVAGVAGFALGSAATSHEDEHKKELDTGIAQSTSSSQLLLPGRFIESEPASADPSPKHFAPDTSVTENPTSVQPTVKEPETLALSGVSATQVEPVAAVDVAKEPEKLAMSAFSVSSTEPVVIAPTVKEAEKFSLSQYPATHTTPVASMTEIKRPAPFSIAAYSAAHTEPVAREIQQPNPLAVSPFKSTSTEPYFPPQLDPIKASPFTMTPLASSEVEPYFPPQPEPVKAPSYAITPLTSTHVEPVAAAVDEPKDSLAFSTVRSQQWEPELNQTAPANVDSSIAGTDATRPAAAFLASLDGQFPPRTSSRDSSHIEQKSLRESGVLGRFKGANLEEPTLVFADENVPTPRAQTSDQYRQPFSEVSNNAASSVRSMSNDGGRPAFKRSHTSETGTQTMVSSDEIDKMMRRKTPMQIPAVNVDESSPLKPESPRRASETPSSSEGANIKAPRRPASSGSMRRSGAISPPPLPDDHNQRIAAAAAQRSLSPTMGPPAMPASAYGRPPPSLRSRTPSISKSVQSARGTMNRPMAPIPARIETMSPTTRTSSINSFASELDERFQINKQNGMIYPEDVLPSTDPRMIQAITQTMIGEYLWKYTRKAGRSEISASRHRRFFWVHPYTRTLYWSEHDPSTMGKQQSKAKSVAIEAVRVISDDNAYPPGLHRKSLVIITPGREIVFTAPTAQRHDTWFNALSYLLLRTGPERENDDMTREEVDEFNPQMRSTSRATARTRMSLSSYNSRATGRTSSPHRQHASEVPSLANRPSQAASLRMGARTPGSSDGSNRPSIMGGLFKNPGDSLRGSFSSRRSKSAMSQRRPIEPTIYDASVIEDSTDDLRAVIEGQERDLGRLENVRACCDGKHDVGSLSRNSGRHAMGHTHSHVHNHGEPSTISSRRPR